MGSANAVLTNAGVICTGACSDGASEPTYGAAKARIGESPALLGWNLTVANLRWHSDHVLVDVDAAGAGADTAHTNPEDVRSGVDDTLAHPVEATEVGSCDARRPRRLLGHP